MNDASAVIRRQLERAAASGRLAHALLFAGPRGTGKRAMALWLAQKLQCEAAPEAVPCGQCPPCAKIARGTHPDVLWLRPEAEDAAASAERKAQGKTPRQIISVDQVRALESRAALAPFEGKVRAVVIDSADRMEAEGMNALLKLVEEPPPRTYLVLLAMREEAVLPTIRSRSQVLRFRRMPGEELVKKTAERLGWKPDEARWAAALLGEEEISDDAAADGEHLRGERRACLAALEAISAPDAVFQILQAADGLSRDEGSDEARHHREALRMRLEIIQSLLRDALALKLASGNPGVLLHPDAAGRLREVAAALSEETLLRAAHLTEEAARALERNVERRLLVEHLLFELRKGMQGSSAAA